MFKSDADAIVELATHIRDYVNAPRKFNHLVRDRSKWHLLCSAMDAIGDVELGIDAYSSMPATEDKGTAYLLVYGLLQLLFAEQDALQVLREALKQKERLPSELWKIRTLRHYSIGHATRTDDGASHFIARYSLSKGGFQLMSVWPDGRTEFSDVSLDELIRSQRSAVRDILQNVLDFLKKEKSVHREQFKTDKLADAFPPTMPYYLSKIAEGTSEYGSKPLALVHLKIVAEIIEKFEQGLCRRGLSGATGDDYHLKELVHPLTELHAYLADQPNNRLTAADAYIFSFFISDRMERLRSMAEEIDAEYDREPTP